MTLNEVYFESEEKYLKELFEKYSKNGIGRMAVVAGITRKMLVHKLYNHGITWSERGGIYGRVTGD